jgi:hypothetical protein
MKISTEWDWGEEARDCSLEVKMASISSIKMKQGELSIALLNTFAIIFSDSPI